MLAVEIYNKSRLNGRLKSYIVHMNIEWTKLFQIYYHREGIKYFYKDKKGKYIRIDGEKTWELKTGIDKYKNYFISK